jgi:hypothetical protein
VGLFDQLRISVTAADCVFGVIKFTTTDHAHDDVRRRELKSRTLMIVAVAAFVLAACGQTPPPAL